MKNLLPLSLLILIVGCTTVKTPEVEKIKTNQTIEDCEEIPDFIGKTMGDLYEYTVNNYYLYNKCANKVKLLKSL